MTTPENICRDFSQWPQRWMGVKEDLVYGERLLGVMREFVQRLIDKGLAQKTVRRHMDNLWLLGGEVIRDVSLFEEYDVPAFEKLSESVDECGGPECRHLDTEAEMKAFNATCRMFHKFLQSMETEDQ